MFRVLILTFIFVFLTGCGVSTSSSETQNSDSNGTGYPTTSDDNINNDVIYLVDSNPVDGTDIGDGIVYIDPNPIGDGCNCEDDNQTDNNQTDGGQTDGGQTTGESEFDKVNAVEDTKACFIGSYSDGYTNNYLRDNNKDYLAETDLEDGVGVLSRYPSTGDASVSEVILFYYDLKPERTLDVKTYLHDKFSVMIDMAWAQNDETVLYVRTPKNDDGLYGCYRVDTKTMDVDGSVVITKVYRLNR